MEVSRNHNNPPDPIDEITAQFEATRLEAENWLDGQPVTTEPQMQAVDELRKGMRDYRISLERGQESEAKPIYDEYKRVRGRWDATIKDAKRIEAGCVALVDGFKQALARHREEEERRARAEAQEAARKAHEAAQAANAADIEAQRAAAAAQREAEEAQKRAAQASKANDVKGLRTVTRHAIDDYRAALHDIAQSDRDGMTLFIEEYVRKHHATRQIAGVRVWVEKIAY